MQTDFEDIRLVGMKCFWPNCSSNEQFYSFESFVENHLNVVHKFNQKSVLELFELKSKVRLLTESVKEKSSLIADKLSAANSVAKDKKEIEESENENNIVNEYLSVEDWHFYKHNDVCPPMHKVVLIAEAFKESTSGQLKAVEIENWIEANFLFYKNNTKEDWKILFRVALSANSCFERIDAQRNGYWKLNKSEYNKFLDQKMSFMNFRADLQSPSVYAEYLKKSEMYKTQNIRPPFIKKSLIHQAITESTEKELTKEEIYAWIESKFMFYRTNSDQINKQQSSFVSTMNDKKLFAQVKKGSITKYRLVGSQNDVENLNACNNKELEVTSYYLNEKEKEFYKENDIYPPFTYIELIAQALKESENGFLKFEEICNWIETNFKFYKNSKKDWKRSFTTRMYKSSFCFEKIKNNYKLNKLEYEKYVGSLNKSSYFATFNISMNEDKILQLYEKYENIFATNCIRIPFSFESMAELAIMQSAEKQLSSEGIFKWIETKFMFYKNSNMAWRKALVKKLKSDKRFTMIRTNNGAEFKLADSSKENCIEMSSDELTQTNELQDPNYFYKIHDVFPTYSYAFFIKKALSKSKENKMSIDEILEWIRENFLYYKENFPSLERSIYTVLKANKQSFINVDKKIWANNTNETEVKKDTNCFFNKYCAVRHYQIAAKTFYRHRDFFKTRDIAPPYYYFSLIRQAILESSSKSLDASQIFDWFSNNFMYFKNREIETQREIGRHLREFKCFEEVNGTEPIRYQIDELEFKGEMQIKLVDTPTPIVIE